MTRIKPFLLITIVCCLMIPRCGHAQELSRTSDDQKPNPRLQLIDAETNVMMLELELKLAELSVDERAVEREKIKRHLEEVKQHGNARETANVELALKQAAIRYEMQKVEGEMVRLRLKRAKIGLEFTREALGKKPEKTTRVRTEYVDSPDVIVIRGTKESVDKVTELIERAEKSKKQKEK
jgi:hypothetical protein